MQVSKWEVEAKDRRSEIAIRVYSGEQYDGDWIPNNLVDAVAWLQDVLDEIPPEYRHVATIEIDSHTYYDSDYATIEISYRRPETDEEWAARKADVERRMAQDEACERAQFEQLKRKFEQ